ncbi:MAG: UPF0175 family protein [Methanomassiliicoccales archaeon]|jgi:predicted HTH domain antitoxin|nr:UPF0175 family protein [Methanomassiliicoccales archaeon]
MRGEELELEEQVVLYCIGALNRPLRSELYLQKLLFLVSNVFPELKDELRFEPHLMGPYSFKVSQILEDLITDELVEKRKGGYKLTQTGGRTFSSLTLPRELRNVIEEFKDILPDLTEDELLVFVYALYPDYISESTRWDRLRPKRKELAASILRKSKVSFSQAARIAGMNSVSFADYLKKRGIRIDCQGP